MLLLFVFATLWPCEKIVATSKHVLPSQIIFLLSLQPTKTRHRCKHVHRFFSYKYNYISGQSKCMIIRGWYRINYLQHNAQGIALHLFSQISPLLVSLSLILISFVIWLDMDAIKCAHPSESALPMKPQNMPYYGGPRLPKIVPGAVSTVAITSVPTITTGSQHL